MQFSFRRIEQLRTLSIQAVKVGRSSKPRRMYASIEAILLSPSHIPLCEGARIFGCRKVAAITGDIAGEQLAGEFADGLGAQTLSSHLHELLHVSSP